MEREFHSYGDGGNSVFFVNFHHFFDSDVAQIHWLQKGDFSHFFALDRDA